jgi:hypothetical protein
MSNILKKYLAQFNSTNPNHHQTILLMVCMFQRFLLVWIMFSPTDKIRMCLSFLEIYNIPQGIIVSWNHSVYPRDTMDETIQTLNDRD